MLGCARVDLAFGINPGERVKELSASALGCWEKWQQRWPLAQVLWCGKYASKYSRSGCLWFEDLIQFVTLLSGTANCHL